MLRRFATGTHHVQTSVLCSVRGRAQRVLLSTRLLDSSMKWKNAAPYAKPRTTTLPAPEPPAIPLQSPAGSMVLSLNRSSLTPLRSSTLLPIKYDDPDAIHANGSGPVPADVPSSYMGQQRLSSSLPADVSHTDATRGALSDQLAAFMPQLSSSCVDNTAAPPPPPAYPLLPQAPAAVARRPLCDLIHNITWVVARAFGFQAFNSCGVQSSSTASCSPPGPTWVPSTAFLAADHLETLLLRNIMPRLVEEEGLMRPLGVIAADKPEETKPRAGEPDADVTGPSTWQQQVSFARAVWELHSHIFLSYEGRGSWCRLVGVSARPAAVASNLLSQHSADDVAVVHGLLRELALYFLLYSEAANLRHTPELLWFLFWAAVHSRAMETLGRQGLRPEQQLSNAAQRRLVMRNALQAQLLMTQRHLGHNPAACSPERCAQAAVELSSQLVELLPHLSLPMRADSPDLSLSCAVSRELFCDLACHGDGGFWTDVLVSPLFTVLAFEVDLMASSGQEVAHRLGYDDINESMCHRDIVGKLLVALGVSEAAANAGQVHGALEVLTRLGGPPGTIGDIAIPGGASAESCDPRHFDPVLAASFWEDCVFVKTHRERRSWLALLRAFYRVYSLQLVILHATMAAAFVPGSLHALSSTVLTHAAVAALERTANWWLSRGTRDPLQSARSRESWTLASTATTCARPIVDAEAGRGDGARNSSGCDSSISAASFNTPPRRSCLSDDGAVDKRMARRRKVRPHEVCGRVI